MNLRSLIGFGGITGGIDSSTPVENNAPAEDVAIEFPEPFPEIRFTAWNDLEASTRSDAEILEYNELSWNIPGTNEIEELSFATIEEDYGDDFTDALVSIGFDEDTYDCWVNHYNDYDWFELIMDGLTGFWIALGWDEDKWEGDDPNLPDSEDKDWEELNEAEQSAANNLCLTQELWDMVPITAWEDRNDPIDEGPVDVTTTCTKKLLYDPCDFDDECCSNRCAWNQCRTSSSLMGGSKIPIGMDGSHGGAGGQQP